jgi:exosortase/archaeosortase family protein
LIQVLGGNSVREGATLRSGVDAILTVKPFCTAFDYSWFLIAAIVTFPARLGQKLVGLAIGVPLLLALNVLRISSFYWTGIKSPWNFGFMHEQFWAVLLNFSTICCEVFLDDLDRAEESG